MPPLLTHGFIFTMHSLNEIEICGIVEARNNPETGKLEIHVYYRTAESPNLLQLNFDTGDKLTVSNIEKQLKYDKNLLHKNVILTKAIEWKLKNK